MWLHALGHFVACAPAAAEPASAEQRAWREHIGEVISIIESDELISPFELLRRLSEGGNVPLDLASTVLERHITSTEGATAEQQREAARSSEDNARMMSEIGEIDHGTKIFQLSKCSACHGPLETPTVHFLCMHSYHQACLGDHDLECLVCAPQRRRVAEHQHQQRALARSHDEFFKTLETSADGFGTIAEFLGRGILCAVDD